MHMALDPNVKIEDSGEQLTADQADKIAPTVPKNNLAAAFAKIGGKFVGTVGGKTPAQVNAGAPSGAPSEEIPSGSPWHDAASPILRAASGITDADREQLWDAFAESRDPQTLATKLAHPNFDHVDNSIKHDLFTAKVAAMPAQSHADKVVGVVNHLAKLASTPEGKKMLAIAESHPTLLKYFTQMDKGKE
jgi:hypothetical protein